MIARPDIAEQRFVLGLIASLLIRSVMQAADDPVRPREVYWQVLPGLRSVYVDQAGTPWFPTAEGDPAQSICRELQQLHHNQILLLGDRRGRLWIDERYGRPEPTKLFDGENWHDTGIFARKAFEDSAGRVFLFDTSNVHVLDGDTWSKQQVAPKTRFDEHFVEDPKGRVWFWARNYDSSSEKHPGTRGVWCFDDGKWTNYNPDSKLPAEHIHVLVPLTDDRFLVFPAMEDQQSECFLWSPSRDLPAQEHDVLKLSRGRRLSYLGVDLDGFHHFGADGLIPWSVEFPSTRGRVVVSPQGETRLLSRAEAELARRLPVGVYENKYRIFGRLTDLPPVVPGELDDAICRDRFGRVYFRARRGVGVLWAKFEKPGDVVRFQTDTPHVQPLAQTPDGAVWGLPSGSRGLSSEPSQGQVCLVRWDGQSWADTPVRALPHPRWTAHPMPPWSRWGQQTPPVLFGGNSVLAALMRDIYQDIQAEAKGEELDHREILRLAQAKAGATRETWSEAWLYHDGKWAEPAEVPSLAQKHWEALAGAYTKPAGQATWFALQGDGKNRLWVAYDSRVSVFDHDGHKEWAMPADTKPHVRQYHFCPLPDGRMLLSYSTGGPMSGGYRHTLRALSIKDEGIVVEDFPAPDWGDRLYYAHAPVTFVGQDQTVWLTMLMRRDSRNARVWRLRDNQWEERNDLGKFLFEEKDGSLWFMPGREHDTFDPELRGYQVVKGNQTSTFPWPADYEFGELTPTLDGRLLAACGRWLVELGKADDPMKRTITKARIPNRYIRGLRVFEANDGTVFFSIWRGK